MTTIEIHGTTELQAKLNKLADKRYGKLAFLKMGLHLKAKMKRYPRQKFAANPNRVYKRTGFLRRSWTAKAKSDQVTVGNFARYSPYVQGDETQAHWHRATGWQTLRATAEKNEKQLVKILKSEVDRILEGR
jgi:hypothetical protein